MSKARSSLRASVRRSIVAEVTDDKSLPKAERKRLQIEHAAEASPEAQLVKLADKICNFRDLDTMPPANWSIERQREYFNWSKAVVDRIRDRHATLARLRRSPPGGREFSSRQSRRLASAGSRS